MHVNALLRSKLLDPEVPAAEKREIIRLLAALQRADQDQTGNGLPDVQRRNLTAVTTTARAVANLTTNVANATLAGVLDDGQDAMSNAVLLSLMFPIPMAIIMCICFLYCCYRCM